MTDTWHRGLLWPSLFALACLVVLLALGTWQMARKAWKEGLIAQITERVHAPPVSLAEALRRAGTGSDIEYLRVRIAGRFPSGRESHYWAPGSQGPGWHVYAPFVTSEGRTIIVNRGFVPDAQREAARRPPPPSGQVELVGLLRAPATKGTFTPDNDRQRNLWYWRDLKGMTQAMLGPDATGVVPYFLDVEAPPPGSRPHPGPRGGTTLLTLPNSHLQYAVTWYGLALTLIGVYAAFVRARMRDLGARPKNSTGR